MPIALPDDRAEEVKYLIIAGKTPPPLRGYATLYHTVLEGRFHTG